MSSYKIKKDYDFAQISRAVMWKEAQGYIFKNNTIGTDANGQFNKATFDYYDGGAYPPDCLLQADTKAAPEGYSSEWTGPMLVAGINRRVSLFRKEE